MRIKQGVSGRARMAEPSLNVLKKDEDETTLIWVVNNIPESFVVAFKYGEGSTTKLVVILSVPISMITIGLTIIH